MVLLLRKYPAVLDLGKQNHPFDVVMLPLMDFLTLNEDIFTILEDDHNFYLTLNARKTSAHKNHAARIIQNAWKRYKKRRIFNFIKNKLIEFTNEDPVRMLRRVSVFEAQLFEKKYGHCLVFRMAGHEFPPIIVYKVFISSQRNIGNGDMKNVMNAFNRNEWGVFYVYKSIHETVLSAKRKLHKNVKVGAKNKRKKSGIEWIKKLY